MMISHGEDPQMQQRASRDSTDYSIKMYDNLLYFTW